MVLRPIRLINYLVLGVRIYFISTCESRLGSFAAFELNVISSIFLLHWGPKGTHTAGTYIYWQILGTAFFAFSCIVSSSNLTSWSNGTAEILVWGGFCFGFLVKIGCFPFHYWFWDVLVKHNWINIFIFGVLNKYGQFLVVRNFGFSNSFYSLFFFFFFHNFFNRGFSRFHRGEGSGVNSSFLPFTDRNSWNFS